ncbi:MAG TPA: EamA family transporter [Planctomycetota bacterium]|nr:EamA family transporter [Planctomycetota bacterium]HRR82305.1 EamA family transporter [Planctomycetota bacterium]HRT97577.1 EamA family transporter [Planctomycetota bacterium]
MSRRALVLGVLACVSWSTVFVLGRMTIRHHATDPVVLGLYRFGLTGLVLAATLILSGRGGALGVVIREPAPFLFLGLTGGFAMGFFVFLALQHTHSIVVQVIMNSNPVLIVPLSLLVGERVGVGKVCGVALGVAGCVLVLGGVSPEQAHENPRHVLGGVLAGLSGLSWAAYTVFGRRVVRRHGGLVTTTLSMLIGGVAFLVACLAMGKGLALPWRGALAGVYLALVPTAFGFTAWYVALKDLPANVLGPLQFVVPVGGVALALLLLPDERLTAPMLLGGIVALAGVFLSTREAAGPRARGSDESDL